MKKLMTILALLMMVSIASAATDTDIDPFESVIDYIIEIISSMFVSQPTVPITPTPTPTTTPAPTPTLTPTPTPTITPTSTPIPSTNIIGLGIYSVTIGLPIKDVRIKNIHTTSRTAISEATIGTHVVYQAQWITCPGSTGLTQWPYTNLQWVKCKFDYYESIKNLPWEYGVYLGMEELFHPSIMASWWPNPTGGSKGRYEALATWTLDGEYTKYGITVKAIRPWYISKYGAWNQAWWNSVSSTNKYADPIVWEWSTYYARKTYEMWNLHMHALGKKSYITGISGIPGYLTTDSYKNYLVWYWGNQDNLDYIMNNYDGFSAYQYPECIYSTCKRDITASTTAASYLNTIARGKITWILTAKWSDNVGTADKSVQLAEYKAVMPYVDVITLPYMSQMYTTPNSEPSVPRLIEYCTVTRTC